MFIKPIRPPDHLADALARAVVGPSWAGTPVELLAAIDAAATEAERQAPTWPQSAAALATRLRSTTDALCGHGLRLSIMPTELLVERLPVGPRPEPLQPGRAAALARRAA